MRIALHRSSPVPGSGSATLFFVDNGLQSAIHRGSGERVGCAIVVNGPDVIETMGAATNGLSRQLNESVDFKGWLRPPPPARLRGRFEVIEACPRRDAREWSSDV